MRGVAEAGAFCKYEILYMCWEARKICGHIKQRAGSICGANSVPCSLPARVLVPILKRPAGPDGASPEEVAEFGGTTGLHQQEVSQTGGTTATGVVEVCQIGGTAVLARGREATLFNKI